MACLVPDLMLVLVGIDIGSRAINNINSIYLPYQLPTILCISVFMWLCFFTDSQRLQFPSGGLVCAACRPHSPCHTCESSSIFLKYFPEKCILRANHRELSRILLVEDTLGILQKIKPHRHHSGALLVSLTKYPDYCDNTPFSSLLCLTALLIRNLTILNSTMNRCCTIPY